VLWQQRFAGKPDEVADPMTSFLVSQP